MGETTECTLTLVREYLLRSLVKRDLAGTIALFSPKIRWFYGDNQAGCGYEEAVSHLRQELSQDSQPYTLVFSEEEDLPLSDSMGTAQLCCCATKAAASRLFRVSAVSCRENGQQTLCVLHVSETGRAAGVETAPHTRALRLELLEQSLGSGILGSYCAPNNPVYLVNHKLLEDLGYAGEAEFRHALKENVLQCIAPEDRLRMEAFFARQTAVGSHYIAEYRMLGKNGRNLWVQDHGKTILTENGRPAIIHVVDDVTARRQETEELAQRAKRAEILDLLVNSASGGIFRSNLSNPFGLEYANATYYALAGYTKEQFENEVGNSFANVIFPEDLVLVSSQLQEYLNGRDVDLEFDYRIHRRNGEIAWMHTSAVLQKYDADNTVMVGFVIDITKSKQNEIEFKRQALELNNLYNTIPGGVFRCKSNPDGDVVFANDGFYEFLGYTRQTFAAECHNQIRSVLFSKDFASTPRHVRAQLAHGNLVESVNRVICRDGTVKWISMHAVQTAEADGQRDYYCTFVDITAQKEAEEKLRQSEQRYRFAVEGAGIYVWEYDILRHQLLSSALDRVPDASISGSSLFTMMDQIGISPDQQSVVEDLFRRMESGESPVTADFWTTPSPDSPGRSCQRITFSVVFDSGGSPLRAYGISMDVTQSKLAEKRYQEEMTYRDQIAESIVATSCVNLTVGVVEFMRVEHRGDVARQYQGITDYRQRTQAFLTQSLMSDEQNHRLSPEALRQQYNLGITSVHEEFQGQRGTTGFRWFHVDVHLIKSPDTGDLLAFFYNQDKTEEILRDSITATVLTRDYASVGIVDLRSGTFRKLCGSDAFVVGAERSYATALAKFCRERVAPEDRARLAQMLPLSRISQPLRQGKTLDVKYTGLLPSGKHHYMQMRFQILDNHPDIVLITRSDVDKIVRREQKKQQLLTQAVQDAKQANASKTDFLARMSHDMRTPMNAIIGMSALGLDETSDPQARYYFQNIDLSANFLLGLINDVLDMSKVESGAVELHPEPYHLEQFRAQINTMIAPLCQSKQLEFHLDIQPTDYPWVEVDRLRFNQIFFNLLSNAVKYTPAGGRIDFIVEHLSQRGDMARKRLTVRDTGIGMSLEFQKHMFEPFSQERTGTTAHIEGTGLGLTITKRIVDLMGGSLCVTSIPGKGSAFVVELEMRVLTEKAGPTQQANPIFDGDPHNILVGKRILLCEDHPLNTQIAIRLLSKQGMLVEHAENGMAGLQLFSASPVDFYDLILMDIRMPVMDGLETTRAIRSLKRPDAQKIPIVAMTANAYDADVENSMVAGMNAHLSKPIEPRLLYQTLAQQLECQA